MSAPVGVIGLGSIGWGAAVSLLRAGFAVRGVDVRPEVLERFRAQGGETAATPAEAAQGAAAVLVFVVNAEQTDMVLFGPDGAVAVLPQGAVVLSCATAPPDFAAGLGRRVAAAGLLPIDAPTSGGAARAEAGELTIMASGPDAAFEAAAGVLDAIAVKVYRLGPEPGMGSRVKMINQLLAGVHIAAACEAMSLGLKAGIDGRTLYEVICASAGSSWMFQNRVPHILDGDYRPRSAVDIFVKDLGIVREAGERLGMPLPIAETAHALFTEASAEGMGREDDAAVAKIYARKGGLKLP